MHRLILSSLAATVLAAAPSIARADTAAQACPELITKAVVKAHADAKVQSCKEETEHGKTQFEVKLETKAGKLELDVTPDGSIVKTEEVVKLESVPNAVMKAFAAKYGAAKADKAEKQTAASGKVSYELAFHVEQKRREASFGEDGAFLEEE